MGAQHTRMMEDGGYGREVPVKTLKDYDVRAWREEARAHRESGRPDEPDPWPDGWYEARILAAEANRPTRAGNGYMHVVECEVLRDRDGVDGQQCITHYMTHDHPNAKVAQWGRDAVAALCEAVDYPEEQEGFTEAHLVGQRMEVRLKQKENTWQGETRMENRITGFRRAGR